MLLTSVCKLLSSPSYCNRWRFLQPTICTNTCTSLPQTAHKVWLGTNFRYHPGWRQNSAGPTTGSIALTWGDLTVLNAKSPADSLYNGSCKILRSCSCTSCRLSGLIDRINKVISVNRTSHHLPCQLLPVRRALLYHTLQCSIVDHWAHRDGSFKNPIQGKRKALTFQTAF